MIKTDLLSAIFSFAPPSPSFRNRGITVIALCILFLSVLSFPSIAAEQADYATFPIPLREATEILHDWLQKEGFQVEQSVQNEYTVLQGKKMAEEWRIQLRPDSSLATKVNALYLVSSKESEAGRAYDVLAGYLAPPPDNNNGGRHHTSAVPEEGIPPLILNLLDAVVCVRADHNGTINQFSGFFVDSAGLILTTAHGLEEKQTVRVMLYDGSETEATVVIIDQRADLAVLRITVHSGNFIPIEKGRNLLGIGEKIFTMGCPLDLQGTIYSGTVNGPPRRMEGLPYWQVDMVIFQGSSGSPVFDAQGNFIAMVKGKYRGTESIGFLIPLQTIMEFLQGKD